MQLTEPVQKRTNEEKYGAEGLRFCATREGAQDFLERHCAGKALLLTDAESYKAFAPFALMPRTVSFVFDGDALPLFLMPDGVSCILAAGGTETLWAARFFASVRNVPCALFPASGTLFGVYERRAKLRLGDEIQSVALADGEVIFDRENGFSLSEAYAQLYLNRLARFEAETLALFQGTEPPISEEILSDDKPPVEELILENARLRLEERNGFPTGEGRILTKLHAEAGEKRPVFLSVTELSALYYAFFKCGKPRRYYVPDYAERARRAGVSYAYMQIPTNAEYCMRAVALERMRSERLVKIRDLAQKWQKCPFSVGCVGIDLSRLKSLPERGGGLSAIIRDFGLLEY